MDVIPIERGFLDELIKKAAAWDRHQEKTEKTNLARLKDEMHSSAALGTKIDIARAVPSGQTIVVTNLPPVSGVELMNSFLATGGIRYYHIFSEPGRDLSSSTALITFVTPDSAKNYLSYVSRHGFFLSKKLPASYISEPGIDECVYTCPDTKFQCLFKRVPSAIAKPWLGVERISGKLITGDEGGYCNVPHAIDKEGATRSLVIIPGIEIKELYEELKHLISVPELRIESIRLRTATPPRKGLATTIRFCSIRDAVMAKDYLSLLKSFSGPEGKIVKYVKSPTDKPTENLGWHICSEFKLEKLLPTGGKVAFDTTRPNNREAGPTTKTNGTSPAGVGGLPDYPPRAAGSDTEDSDADSDLREISFSLAKEAFRPYITSASRVCFPSLCHTPAPGDHTPEQPRHHLYQEDQSISKVKEEDIAAPVTSTIGAKPSSQHESTPSRKKYPHELFLSKKINAVKHVDPPELLKLPRYSRNMENVENLEHPKLPGGPPHQRNTQPIAEYGSFQNHPTGVARFSSTHEMVNNLNRLGSVEYPSKRAPVPR